MSSKNQSYLGGGYSYVKSPHLKPSGSSAELATPPLPASALHRTILTLGQLPRSQSIVFGNDTMPPSTSGSHHQTGIAHVLTTLFTLVTEGHNPTQVALAYTSPSRDLPSFRAGKFWLRTQ